MKPKPVLNILYLQYTVCMRSNVGYVAPARGRERLVACELLCIGHSLS